MMAWIATFTLLLATVIPLTSTEDPDALNVLYQRGAKLTAVQGSSVTLIAQVKYDPKRCGQVHAVWSHMERELKLIDPDKYLTKVNETIINDTMRHRQVSTEILTLNSEDVGGYQCMADCSRSGGPVMGHLITVELAN